MSTQDAQPVHQFRKRGTGPWWDGYPDNEDGGGPYETRTLYARAALAAQQAEPSGREVLHQVFALCEDTENKPVPELDSRLKDFTRGRQFEAKSIRKAIGTWHFDAVGAKATTPPLVQPMSDGAFDLICGAIDKADSITMGGDYMLDSNDCIAVVRTMQALLSTHHGITQPQAKEGGN